MPAFDYIQPTPDSCASDLEVGLPIQIAVPGGGDLG
jgi:hypothetical protein